MIFNLFYFLFLGMLLSLLNGSSMECLFFIWYILNFILIVKLYSHIGFMLLVLELISMVSMVVLIFTLSKTQMEVSMFFFFLCLIVGEASLGLSLMVMGSRFQSKELTTLSVV